MGISKLQRLYSFALALSVFAVVSVQAQTISSNTTLVRLERGEVVSSKAGSAVLIQALVKKDQTQVKKNLFQDYKMLPKFFPNIAFARPYVGAGKEKKQLIYLKLRGAGDGLGVVLEAKKGAEGLFTNARELVMSAQSRASRQAATEEFSALGDGGLSVAVAASNEKSQWKRTLGKNDVVLFEGPLNPIPQMPGLRITLAIATAPYRIAQEEADDPEATAKKYTLLQFRVAIGNQAIRGETLGDYKGFGDRKLEMAKISAINVMSILKARLEQL